MACVCFNGALAIAGLFALGYLRWVSWCSRVPYYVWSHAKWWLHAGHTPNTACTVINKYIMTKMHFNEKLNVHYDKQAVVNKQNKHFNEGVHHAEDEDP